jgi:hypothetical protein
MCITIPSSIIVGTIATTTIIIIITLHVSPIKYLEYSQNKNLHAGPKDLRTLSIHPIFLEPFTYDKNKNATTFFAKRIRLFFQLY